MSPPRSLHARLSEVLALPRGEQPAALRRLRADLPARDEPEIWNSRFGPGTLFEAWTRSGLMRDLYAANARVVAEHLAGRRPFVAVEVGGGNGALWALALPVDARGQLWIVDPVAEVEAQVRRRLPAGVELRFVHAPVEVLAEGSAHQLPSADLVLCSLTLHHVAGRDAAERARHGLAGAGKGEVLDLLRACLVERRGLLIVNEADVHCEVDLPPADPLLEERMLDSYVRRCAVALLREAAACPDPDLAARWEAIALHWCIEQLDLAAVPLEERDVYELDAPRWRSLFAARGLAIHCEVSTDRYALFRQYQLLPR